jgi:hypothetical protein
MNMIFQSKNITNPPQSPFAKGDFFPSLAKRGQGRFYGIGGIERCILQLKM